MRLRRKGTEQNACSVVSSETEISKWSDPNKWDVTTHFRGFGNGVERRSGFAVELSWVDVKGIVQKFAEHGHPEACDLICSRAILEVVREMLSPKDRTAHQCHESGA